MANAVADGIREKAAKLFFIPVRILTVLKLLNMMQSLGCPAMGDEVLEDTEFEPMFDGCKACPERQEHRSVWFLWMGRRRMMRNWEESCKEAGANLVCDSVIQEKSQMMKLQMLAKL